MEAPLTTEMKIHRFRNYLMDELEDGVIDIVDYLAILTEGIRLYEKEEKS